MSDGTLDQYAGSLAPDPYDRTETSTRRGVVCDTLAGSPLKVFPMFESGSWSHGTGIKAKSDVDYMAVASGTRPALPSSALRTAKAAEPREHERCDHPDE